MAIQHAAIGDPDRHEPKGASTASADSFLVAKGDGTTEWRSILLGDLPFTPASGGLTVLLVGSSISASQTNASKSSTDQVEFGPTINTADVSLSSSGVITANNPCSLFVNVNLTLDTVNTDALMVVRILKNGLHHFGPVLKKVTQGNPEQLNLCVPVTLGATETLSVEFSSDVAGTGTGGLYQTTPSTSGWATVPSAQIRVVKVNG